MRVKLTTEPQIQYAEDSWSTDHCTFHFENEDGAIGMAIISGYFGDHHPMPKSAGETTHITGDWQGHDTFLANIQNAEGEAVCPAAAVIREARKAATALMALRNEDDDAVRNIAESVLRMANYASPAEFAVLRMSPDTWLSRIEDEWLLPPEPKELVTTIPQW